jgi:hypothetical protein
MKELVYGRNRQGKKKQNWKNLSLRKEKVAAVKIMTIIIELFFFRIEHFLNAFF